MKRDKRDWKALIIPLGLLVFGVFSAGLVYETTAGSKYPNDNHLLLLAERFGRWKLTLDPANHPIGDYVDTEGRIYLYFGPVAALVWLVPVRIWGVDFPQVLTGVVAWIGVFVIVYKTAEKMKYNETDSLWWAVFFGFSTVMFSVSVVNITAWQVQALGAWWSWLWVHEYAGKQRWGWMGLWLALAGMTRTMLFLPGVFLFLEWWRRRGSKIDLVKLALPVLVAGLVLGGYNWRRFGSPWESGYADNVTLANYPLNANVTYGFFNLKHVPANVYALVFKGFETVNEEGGGLVLAFPWFRADAWGLSILITTPLVVYLWNRRRVGWERSAWVAIGVTLGLLLLYFAVGYAQFGYRYALDFLPLATLLLMAKLGGELPGRAKTLIVLGVVVNCFYLASLWGIYPHVLGEINEGGRVVFGWK